MLQVGSLSNVAPILFPHVFIDLDRQIAGIKAISPITTRPGNPIFLTSVGVDLISDTKKPVDIAQSDSLREAVQALRGFEAMLPAACAGGQDVVKCEDLFQLISPHIDKLNTHANNILFGKSE